MFPTFTPFTSRHPRYIAVVGFSIFILGVVLLGYAYLDRQQSGTINPALQASTAEELKEVELSLPAPTTEEVKALGIMSAPTTEEREAVDTAIESTLMKNR